ncbi:DNA alkylation repair protein [Terrimonas pollutisoli]|uniref:DNA alkylation repair protein n=1 Tax=Terrimonas pollutisoli TaxID=3034147 RepID=UPI0023ECDDBF|nr:DNA alkylation repair protein [Terrimonas sp. H1YJ31]
MAGELSVIQKLLIASSSPEAKAAHQKFVPGKEKIYGVRMPYLNKLADQYKTGGFNLVEELWRAGALEEKVLAVKILGKIAKKDPARSLQLVQLFAENIGSWAVCDAIGMQGLKPILKTHQKAIFDLAKKYNQSPDFWQRRLSLVLVEWYTRFKELHPEIDKLIVPLENDKEYYVKKAIVWIRKNLQKGK